MLAAPVITMHFINKDFLNKSTSLLFDFKTKQCVPFKSVVFVEDEHIVLYMELLLVMLVEPFFGEMF